MRSSSFVLVLSASFLEDVEREERSLFLLFGSLESIIKKKKKKKITFSLTFFGSFIILSEEEVRRVYEGEVRVQSGGGEV